MNEIEAYYNKFNEEKRLDSRHGRVEYITSMKYIHEMIEKRVDELSVRGVACEKQDIKIMDIGAGTGKYSVALANEGYDVTAVELVKHNLGLLKAKKSSVKAYQGNALKLKRFDDESFDITLLFGPMYHLFDIDDKVKALNEAKRVTKKGGYILVAYVMNEYGVLTYGFKERHIKECIENERFSDNYKIIPEPSTLYDYVRLENIEEYNKLTDLKRVKIVTPDGPANYMRPFLNQLDEDEFLMFIDYHLSVCERMDLMGAAAHTLDILTVE